MTQSEVEYLRYANIERILLGVVFECLQSENCVLECLQKGFIKRINDTSSGN